MKRFEKSNEDRIFISYETLTDDNDGPDEAVRITKFLAKSDGVEPISLDAVPCVWKAVVKYKEEIKDPNKGGGRRRLDPEHHDSQRSGPTERPYTPEMLEAMSQMLLDLIKKWGDQHLRLRKTLEGYQEIVNNAFLAASSQSQQILQSSGKSFHIIQVSLPHTGSTTLNNLLVGLFDPEADYKKSDLITITKDIDLLSIYKSERARYDEVLFVVSNRGSDPSNRVSNDVCDYNNVLCIEYEELQYNNPQELHGMVNSLTNRLSARFEYFFGPGFLDEGKMINAVKRLEAMDNAVAAMKNQPSDVTDDRFGAAGGGTAIESATSHFQVNGKTLHIFQASPPHAATEHASTVATNWLMGIFEHEKDYSFMINNREHIVR